MVFLTQSQENSFFQKSKEDFLKHQNESLSNFEPVKNCQPLWSLWNTGVFPAPISIYSWFKDDLIKSLRKLEN